MSCGILPEVQVALFLVREEKCFRTLLMLLLLIRGGSLDMILLYEMFLTIYILKGEFVMHAVCCVVDYGPPCCVGKST